MTIAYGFDVLLEDALFEAQQSVEGVLDDLTDEDLNRLGAYVGHLILSDTERGIDAWGDAFEPYSEAYAKYREEHGRNVNFVDLTFTGLMLGALDWRVDRDTEGRFLRMFFNDQNAAQIAAYHNELDAPRSKMPLRHFFGVPFASDREDQLYAYFADLLTSRQ